MYTKLDRPGHKNDVSANNTTSSSRLFNYLNDEEKLDGGFFNQFGDEISKMDAIQMIDQNNKGLRENEIKFYSLTLNPSEDELNHINSSKDGLVSYTRAVMDNFAKNVKNHDLTGDDLVWVACVHDKRYYTNLDKYNYEKKNIGMSFPYNTIEEVDKWKKENRGECPFENNSIKKGENAHVHIVLSRRNFQMDKSITLHGRNSKEKFSLLAWQQENQKLFQIKFNYKVNENLFSNYHKKYIESRLGKLSNRGYFIDKEKVFEVFSKATDTRKPEILKNLDKLNYHVRKGNLISDPIYFIEHGKEKQMVSLELDKIHINSSVEDFIYKNTTFNNSYDSIVNYKKGIKKRKKRNINKV